MATATLDKTDTTPDVEPVVEPVVERVVDRVVEPVSIESIDPIVDPANADVADELLSQIAEAEIDKLMVEDSNGQAGETPTQSVSLDPADSVASTLRTVDTTQQLLDQVKQSIDASPSLPSSPSQAKALAREIELDESQATFEDVETGPESASNETVRPQAVDGVDAELADSTKHANATEHATNDAHAGVDHASPMPSARAGFFGRILLGVLGALSFPLEGSGWLRKFVAGTALLTLVNACGLLAYVMWFKK